jgi:pyruvate dehydrogenase E1 component alpha subunit
MVVLNAVRSARDRAARGGGPTLIEAMTERLVGHYVGDVQQYRPAGEIDDAKTREPLVISAQKLLVQGFDDVELKSVETQERDRVASAASAALQLPFADPATALEFVYDS